MSVILKDKSTDSFINPSFKQLKLLDNSNTLIFSGFLTIGDYNSINTSIKVSIFRKANQILIVGGADTENLIEQNKKMLQFNRNINDLRRELIQEKQTLQSTLTKLNNSNTELFEINKSKDRFISILAHDLKGPFFSLLGSLELLTDNFNDYNTEEIKELIGLINQSTKNTYNLLEDLLIWVKAESGNLEYNPQKLLVYDIYTNVIESIGQMATSKEIHIDYLSPKDVFIYADIFMVNTIMRNLISNAIKFTEQKGKITVATEKNDSDVIITVSDNGIGVPTEKLKALFDSSHKTTTDGTANEKGTGLGLLLCKELIEQHGGKIWAESELKKGADFKFTIPINTNVNYS
jgi:signal transduction histidine kinase